MFEVKNNVLKETKNQNILDEKNQSIIDELFADIGVNPTITENTLETTSEKDESISFDKIKDFENNPFNLYDDEKLEELAQSIKDDGLLSPIFLWQRYETYTILSGHNRFRALKKLGYESLSESMYKVVSNISDDDARLIVADANLCQREKLLPSERAKAYKIQQEVLKNKNTSRSDVFAKILEENAQNPSEMAEHKNLFHDETKEKRVSMWRYLRLNYLISELLEKIDKKEISIVIGVELSYLKEDEQKVVYQYFFEESKCKLTLDICKKIREKAEKIAIIKEIIDLIVESVLKPKNSRTFKLNFKEIRELSKKELKTDKEAKEYILECIKYYEANKENELKRGDFYG